MSQELYSVEQVAERLGLHVRTVRNYVRDGRLEAVRIGKQYRIAREDLEAFTGRPVADVPRESARRHRHVEVSSIVQVDAIDADTVSRVSTLVTSSLNGRRAEDALLRVQTAYDEERASMKIIVLGSLEDTAAVLRLISALTEVDR
jgi:excisionase family DNA binding protein